MTKNATRRSRSSLFNRRRSKKKQTKTKIDETELKLLVQSINLSSKQEAKLMQHYVGRKNLLIDHLKTLKSKQDEMEEQLNLNDIVAATTQNVDSPATAADGTVVENDTTDMDSCLDKIIESATDDDENKSLLSELTNPRFVTRVTSRIEEEYLSLSKLLKMASISVDEDEQKGTTLEQDALSLVDSIGNKLAMGFKDILSTVVEEEGPNNIEDVATEEQDGNVFVEPSQEVDEKGKGCIITQWEEFERLMTSMNFCMPISSSTNTADSSTQELKTLLQNANIKREASLLSKFAGEEDKLIAHLKRYQDEKEQKAELNSLLQTAELMKSETKNNILEKYAGREDVLIYNLRRYQDETENTVDVGEDDRNDAENPAVTIDEEVRA